MVTKLFHATWPHLAVFGQKDYQQLAIIRRMVIDLDFGIEIASCPIVREDDGLAMSSRNAYLSAEERAQAPALNRALSELQDRFESGERRASELLGHARGVLDEQPLIDIDYLELRDVATLEPVEVIDSPAVALGAVFLGRTRLIDNRELRRATATKV